MAKEIFCASASTSTRSPAGSAPTAARTRRTTSRAASSPARSARRRLLKLFDRYGLKTTWFIPGHSIETFPEETAAGRRRGPRDRHARLHAREPDRDDPRAGGGRPRSSASASSSSVSGRRPTGYVAPWWEFSNVTNELLLKHGIKYDHSLMHHDFQPYYVRVGDSWTKIDYSKRAGGVDEAARARRGDRPDRDPGELVPRRPAADDVHQGARRTATASSTRGTSRSSGATSSTRSTARTTTPSSR